MKDNKANLILFTTAIVIAALTRLLPHPPNFTPIAAIALFGSSMFNKKYLGFVIALASMILSDALIGFHSTLFWVYLSFALISLIGYFFLEKKAVWKLCGASLFSSVLFFLITNLGVWLNGGLYPQNSAGLLECYTMAIPFFLNSIAGDLFFTLLIFGIYFLVEPMVAVKIA